MRALRAHRPVARDPKASVRMVIRTNLSPSREGCSIARLSAHVSAPVTITSHMKGLARCWFVFVFGIRWCLKVSEGFDRLVARERARAS